MLKVVGRKKIKKKQVVVSAMKKTVGGDRNGSLDGAARRCYEDLSKR